MAEEKGTFERLVDQAIDLGTGTLRRFIDLEFADDELRIAKDLQIVRQANAAELDERRGGAGAFPQISGGLGAINGTTLALGIGVVALIALLPLLRR